MTDSLITTPFGAESTAAEVIEGIDLGGKRAIVTGGSSGIGVETAKQLAAAGAEVTLAVRNREAGEEVATDISETTGNTSVDVGHLDLDDLASVADFVTGWDGPLDILVNNAGIMALPELELTADGWEQQFATNHLGHFALTTGLHSALALSGDARVVCVSSRGHMRSPVVFADINFKGREYDPFLGYGQSKTANILLAVEVTRRWAKDGITGNALHPGAIEETNLSRHMSEEDLQALRDRNAFTYKTTAQGAATSILLASSRQLEGIGGRYFEDCNEAAPVDEGSVSGFPTGVAAYALDAGNAEQLWDISEEAIS